VVRLFAEYLEHRSTKKVASEQQADSRRAELWTRVLGAVDPHHVSSAQWDSFIAARASGAIDARGNPVPEAKRKPVRARSVEADCTWLWLVFNWAVKRHLGGGRYLMRENPVRGYEMPRELNPVRPVATADRFEAIREVSDRVTMEVRWNGKRTTQRSYLSELLDIANRSGRRIRAICELRFQDLRLVATATAPYGAVVWPASSDKRKKERMAQLHPEARAAIDRILAERPGIGSAPLFPSPTDAAKPISRHLADSWLRQAEALAGVESLKGGLWHPYRSKWGTERKHLSPKDVAAAGGWESLESLQRSYQEADSVTMLSVVLGGADLRDAKQHAQ
jgi:integrase